MVMNKQKKVKKPELPANQQKVCDIILLMELSGKVNHTKAYQMVFNCKKKTAEASASRMLRNVKVLKYLTRARARVDRALEMTKEEILYEYMNLGKSNIAAYYNDDGSLKNLNELTPEQQLAIHSLEVDEHEYKNKKGKKGVTRKVKLRLHTKKGALDSLAKIKGMMKPDAKDVANFALAMHEAMKDEEWQKKRSVLTSQSASCNVKLMSLWL